MSCAGCEELSLRLIKAEGDLKSESRMRAEANRSLNYEMEKRRETDDDLRRLVSVLRMLSERLEKYQEEEGAHMECAP